MNLPVMGFYFGCRERDEIDVNENMPLLDQRKSLSDEKEDDDVEVDEVIDEWNLALKVHRLDVTMALMRETPLMEQMTSDSEKRKEWLSLEYHCNISFYTKYIWTYTERNNLRDTFTFI